ncbi:E3 ubiquitin-protein ligase RNF14-like isoform X1 [Protopterus annectens]|uniref:E3 ubiquitin-protein ligase RNF14-like isoform X1 n=1 Tax=Protopterus annectens TaxID=7888 RepID=UPI001CF9BE9F|nr:E3 ubiquitin-protein ligase RNF14-like isoform X1 [Protopterus annectens]XP_043925215.1 E3 ubiquitin-protein ligase RNF14-like isoform X1 [Protopterus annectens]
MSSEDIEAQEDELLALAGIYNEDEFNRTESSQGGEIRICLTLPPHFRVLVDGRNEQLEYIVEFLPPIILRFDLPVDYPSASAPAFTLHCKWLSESQLTSLCTQLDGIWKENKGCVVLFSWMQFLREETLHFLNIGSSLLLKPSEMRRCYPQPLVFMETEQAGIAKAEDAVGAICCDPRAAQDVESWANILPEILDFNQHQKQKCFNNKIYSCKICFLAKLGSDCLCFTKCEHVYCNSCLREYFEIQIKDGTVHLLNCPEPECPSVATPAQVKQLVGEEAFSRYDHLLLQNGLSLMTDVVYCPRLSCQTAVLKEPDSEMAVCNSCFFAFCTKCNLTYHGVAPCHNEVAEELGSPVNENCESTDDSEGDYDEEIYRMVSRKKLAQRYQNEKWVKENAKVCPNCRSPVQKDGGCNKMTCGRCGSFFCWVCLAHLKQNPYDHFQDPDSPCSSQQL